MNPVTQKEFVKKTNEMMVLQDKLNQVINEDWAEADYDWLLAAGMEATEAIEHHGWKWWKAQEMDKQQFDMELVDIWHFLLSHAIVYEMTPSDLYESYKASFETFSSDGVPEKDELIYLLKSFTSKSFDEVFPIFSFFRIMVAHGFTFKNLHYLYVQKSVLNTFRQDNGYKEGTYQKWWNLKNHDGLVYEDNEVLRFIMDKMDPEDQYFLTDLRDELQKHYNKSVQYAA